jgi:hypothetical protein
VARVSGWLWAGLLTADWYFPTTGNPDRLIYLQHGFLAGGPMYSYTASYLAERTNSVVVATTITSNPFAKNGMWVGGTTCTTRWRSFSSTITAPR